MRVRELIEELEGMNPEAEVRFASQPSWPFEYNIQGVVECNPEDESDNEPAEVVYLVEGNQIGYLPGEVKDEIGW
jgi:hypothetical protein